MQSYIQNLEKENAILNMALRHAMFDSSALCNPIPPMIEVERKIEAYKQQAEKDYNQSIMIIEKTSF